MKKGIIIIASITIVLIIAGLIGLSIINNKADKEITTILDDAINQYLPEDAAEYGDVTVNTLKGEVEISDFSYTDGITKMKFDNISLSLPPSEAIALATNIETATLTEIKVQAKDLIISSESESTDIEFGDLNLELRGEIPAVVFSDSFSVESLEDDMGLEYINIACRDFIFMLPEKTGEISVDKYNFIFDIDITVEDLDNAVSNTDYWDFFITNSNSVSSELIGANIDLDNMILEELLLPIEFFTGPIDFLHDSKNWGIDVYEVSDIEEAMTYAFANIPEKDGIFKCGTE